LPNNLNKLLEISASGHLAEGECQRVKKGITKTKPILPILDVLREEKYGAVYLYQQQKKINLLIINKRAGTTAGFEASNLLASLPHKDIVNTLATSRNDGVFIPAQEYQTDGTFQDKPTFQWN